MKKVIITAAAALASVALAAGPAFAGIVANAPLPHSGYVSRGGYVGPVAAGTKISVACIPAAQNTQTCEFQINGQPVGVDGAQLRGASEVSAAGAAVETFDGPQSCLTVTVPAGAVVWEAGGSETAGTTFTLADAAGSLLTLDHVTAPTTLPHLNAC